MEEVLSTQGLASVEAQVRPKSAGWEESVVRCALDDSITTPWSSLAARAGQLPAPAECDMPLISSHGGYLLLYYAKSKRLSLNIQLTVWRLNSFSGSLIPQ